jgi:molecular chaperone GrpE
MAEKNSKDKKEQVENVQISKEAEYLELAQRIKAEFENYKKRNAELSQQSYENGIAQTVAKLLPAIDSFKQAKSTITDENTLTGLDLVLSQILNAFSELGVTKIQAEGEMFNPNYHNAVLTGNDNDKPDNIILEEYQEGFILKNERVIRHSVVKINKL